MKLKTILGMAVAACATLVMSMAVSAATDIKAVGAAYDSSSDTVIVPIVVSTTEMNNLASYDLRMYYDTDKYEYVGIYDDLKVNSRKYYGAFGTADQNNTNGVINWNWYITTTTFPTPDENGEMLIAEAEFTLKDASATVSDSDFTFGVKTLSNQGELDYDMNSYFTFDVTGDLDGNEIVGLAASTDGGVTKQDLDKYVSTTLTEDSTDYASATTKFLVSVANTQGADAVTDITIYGKLEDGTYIPLSSLDQKDFLVQTFKVK